jgi:two-component system chemotaxis sensor kinase CheA
MQKDKFIKQLQAAFKSEAAERLEVMGAGLVALEKQAGTDQQKAILESIFREAHSLKGASRAADYREIETLCQSIETVFDKIRRGILAARRELFDRLHDSVRAIEIYLANPEKGRPPADKSRLAELDAALKDFALHGGAKKSAGQRQPDETSCVSANRKEESGEKAVPEPQAPDDEGIESSGASDPKPQGIQDIFNPLTTQAIRIEAGKLDAILHQAQEMVSLKLTAVQNNNRFRALARSFHDLEKNWNGIDSEKRSLRRFIQEMNGSQKMAKISSCLENILAFFNSSHDTVKVVSHKLSTIAKAEDHFQWSLGRMVDDLLDDTKQAMMLPFSGLMTGLVRMVRDIGRSQGKDVDLIATGGDVEIDRRILERVKDPLVHLLRNAIDHGIEDAQDRIEKGKAPKATIKLSVFQYQGDEVRIQLSDDGRGIDPGNIRETAVRRGLISTEEARQLDDSKTMDLIFKSSLSTAGQVTDMSGRGLGLAIVQESIEHLDGHLTVETRQGEGTSFLLKLPVSLATFRGVLMRTGGRLFVIPSSRVERVLRVKGVDIQTVENRPTIRVDGRLIVYKSLADVLGLSKPIDEKDDLEFENVMVLGNANKQIAYRVDEVLGEQEGLVKNLGKQLRGVPNIMGAAVLGSGKPVPILMVRELLEADHAADVTCLEAGPSVKKDKPAKASILIAEDSVTSRILLVNILESAGYRVKTTVDGKEAYSMLKSETFDLVLSDVEMPRMNGFELTKKIRSDAKLTHTPVILVTGLGASEDRERGIDAGADAYIVKNDFDQSDLLQVIRRHI